jgi:hypothetical protein
MINKSLLATVFALAFVVTGSVTSSVAHAQIATSPTATVGTTSTPIETFMCEPVVLNLHYGSTDAINHGQVTNLQTFLQSQGLFPSAPIGIFGPLTYHAVKEFQSAHGIPTTGFVGPLTRAEIKLLGCAKPTPTPTPVATSTIMIRAITPASGTVGSTVTLTGFGFSSNNTVLFGGGPIRNVPITSSIAVSCTTDPSCIPGIRQTITFTVPSSVGPNCPVGSMCAMYMKLITPGTYDVSVYNDQGTSNTLQYTVTPGGSAMTTQSTN